MKFGFREVCLNHETGPRHPESPSRLRAIQRVLSDRHEVEYVAAPPAARSAATAVHDPDYVDDFDAFCSKGGGRWDDDTIASRQTWDAALASAGLTTWAGESALAGEDGRETPFALCRPPGHHAVPDDAMGFCFLNNVAIAAHELLTAGQADRVAILDWDVHHGNGTQDIFYDRGDVFYASIHEKGLYPDTGAREETGRGAGELTTMNVPLPHESTGTDYLAPLERLVGPAFEAFDPDLLFVSAGFDAHEHDPISRSQVSTEGFGRMTAAIRSTAAVCDAGLAFALEGGYELDPLSESVAMVHEVFDGYEPAPDDGPVSDDVTAVMDAVAAQGYPGL